jgi:hypothetical protein
MEVNIGTSCVGHMKYLGKKWSDEFLATTRPKEYITHGEIRCLALEQRYIVFIKFANISL